MNRMNTLKNIAIGLTALLAAACTNEWDEQQPSTPLREGEIALQCLPPNMAIQHVKTRATDTKTGEEQQINNLHVFIFKSDGSYLTASGSDAFQGYRFVEGGRVTVLQSDMFENQTEAENATVVVVANMPRSTFGEITGQGNPADIVNLESFSTFVYNLPTFTANLPEGGLPMYGRLDNVNLSTSEPATEKIVQVRLKSMMARIDLDFTLNPYPESGNNQYPSLRFDEVAVTNFPQGGTITPQLDSKTVTSGVPLQEESFPVTADDFTGRVMTDNGQTLELTLYMFEHGREAKPFTYPEGITDDEKQRYKNRLAADDAANITLTGVYTNHNGYKYAVTYTIYPGADATDDFTIKANRQYKHNISVRGITVNSLGDEALLDTRVNIDTEENPYFIEMLREREFDSHFNVTPMDVYIYTGGSVKIEIVHPNVSDWVRMEPLKRKAEHAGDGKRPYFTTDLVTNTLAANTSYTVASTSPDQTHEERIYFYLDENVPQRGHRDGQDVEARDATLRFTYTAPDGRTHSRDVTLHQAGMRAVHFTKYSPDYGAGYGANRDDYYFYIEEYEEYLEHYDGKNAYTDTHEGFYWGLNTLESGLGAKRNFYDYMSWGWCNTIQIMAKYRDSNLYPGREMTLNDTPSGAAEYCYNKNKRNEDGTVSEARWFLPTISELEYALERYYGIFDVFQDKWYWSSNPGAAGNNGDNGENTQYARGTRIKYDPNDESGEADNGYVHYRSNPDYPYDYENSTNPSKKGEGGHAPRNTEFRIRAAYIYQVPRDAEHDVDWDGNENWWE